MKYLFNGVEISQDKLKDYRPLEWQDNYQTVILRPITKEEKIEDLKQSLSNTDYLCLKYAEDELTEEQYAPIKAQRKEWREEINRLEEELKNGNNRQ